MSENKGVIENGGIVKRTRPDPSRELPAQPSPGASPTEDGLIEKALRVMGADYSQYDNRWFLHRTKHAVSYALMHEWSKGLFIHECELYFAELGYEWISKGPTKLDEPTEDRYYVEPRGMAPLIQLPPVAGKTEELAYAQAVLAASGIKPTNSEPNEEQR